MAVEGKRILGLTPEELSRTLSPYIGEPMPDKIDPSLYEQTRLRPSFERTGDALGDAFKAVAKATRRR